MFQSRRAFIGSAVAAALLPSTVRAQAAQVRVGYIPILGAAPLFVADREGFAKAAGVEFRSTVFESGPNMISALASGTLDVYVAGVAPLAVARSKGINAVVLTATAIEDDCCGRRDAGAVFPAGRQGGGCVQGLPRQDGQGGPCRDPAPWLGAAHHAPALVV